MSSHTAGHFAAKHPPGTKVSAAVQSAVAAGLVQQNITCQAAHEIASTMGVTPQEVGVAIDLQEGRIQKCQLGLFGYGKTKKKVAPAQSIEPALQSAIESALINGRLPCVDAWRIADASGLPRLVVANACEVLNIRIKPCQLGAF